MTRKFAAAIAAMLVSIGAMPASAQEQGFVTCYMESASQSKFFYSNPVPISKSAMEGIEARFVKMLRDKRFSNVGIYDPPNSAPPTLRGACSFYASEAAATAALGATRRGAAQMGLNELTTPFDG
jgi:hypothetical protein